MDDYLIIAGAQFFGVFFHTILKIMEIDKRRDDDTLKQVIAVFYRENIVSLVLSAGILVFMLFVHWVIEVKSDLDQTIPYFHIWYAVLSLILGYQGQKFIYKLLDKGADFVDSKINEKLK